MRHAYGDRARGDSYEYVNFHDSLVRMGHEVRLFDFFAIHRERGAGEMNRLLLEDAEGWRPDVAVFSLYQDEFDPRALDRLRRTTKTLCFFHDDTWRVDFSRYWARHFDWFSTPDAFGPEKYRDLGLSNVLFFPFGCNTALYKKTGAVKRYDVSFVGEWHPWREWMIKRLRRAGIRAEAFGNRWPAGALALDEMVRVFNESRINLNLSNSASWDARYLLSSPRALANRLRTPKTVEQLKGRHFEICAAGAFQLSYYVAGLERQFELGTEIGVYADPDDMVDKARFYLEHEQSREKIAAAGHARALRDHSYADRFAKAFAAMGLARTPA